MTHRTIVFPRCFRHLQPDSEELSKFGPDYYSESEEKCPTKQGEPSNLKLIMFLLKFIGGGTYFLFYETIPITWGIWCNA